MGSEMCIRDSWSSWRRIDGDKIMNPIIVHRLDGLGNNVSYSVQIKAVAQFTKAVNGVDRTVEGPEYDSDANTAGDQDPFAVTAPLIAAPTNFKVAPTKDGNGSQLTATWNTVNPGRSGGVYVFEYKRTDDAGDSPTGTTDAKWTALTTPCDNSDTTDVEVCSTATRTANLTVDDSAANVGDTYTVRMRVFIASSQGVGEIVGAYAYATAKTKSTPAAPENVVAQYESTTKNVNVSWTGLTGADAEALTGYRVRWYPSAAGAAGSNSQATVDGGTESNYTISGLAKGTYTIEVHALNDIGASAAGRAGGTDGTVTVP